MTATVPADRAGPSSVQAEVEGRAVSLTSLDKVMWPATGFTKGELIEYYRRVAGVLLPHIRGRPLTLGRFPNGVGDRGFAGTECRGRPEWMPTAPVRTAAGEVRRHCVVDGLASLLWVANQYAVELHVFPARGTEPSPGAVILDLDPGPGAGLVECARAALIVRRLLAQLDLEGFTKTSGGAGLHVLVPVGGETTFAAAKSFARSLADHLAAEHGRLVSTGTGDSSAGRVAIGWAQNSRARTTACAYSLRATGRPLVSTPVEWAEVERAVAEGDPARLAFGPWEVVSRWHRLGDPFAPVIALRQRLDGCGGTATD